MVKKKKRVIFRCDGATLPEIGTGHIKRCVAIANTLVKKKKCKIEDISFVTRRFKNYNIGYRLVKSSGFQIEKIPDHELVWNTKKEAFVLKNLDPLVLIIDRLSTKLYWTKELSSRLVCFDDIGTGTKKADVIINGILHNLPHKKNRYVGYNYLFLENTRNRLIKKKINSKIKYVVVSFGGYDHRNLTSFFLETIKNNTFFLKNRVNIDILVGKDSSKNLNKWKKQIKELTKNNCLNIKLSIFVSDFFKRLSKADIAILSGGTTVFNALSMGIAVIGIPQYKHQLDTLKNLESYNTVKLGCKNMSLKKEDFIISFNELANSIDKRSILEKNGQNLIDGKSSDRVIDILSNLL